MPKTFYTEQDIEDFIRRGVFSLEVNDQVVLTDLAYEKANRLGMRLLRGSPDNPPAAPVRPYLAEKPGWPIAPAGSGATSPTPAPAVPPAAQGAVLAPRTDGAELHQRIRSAVIARLGSQVDANLLDVIITRVLHSTGLQ